MEKEERDLLFDLDVSVQEIKERVCSQECNTPVYRYNDSFKEDLIHQLWHLVEELKMIREKL